RLPRVGVEVEPILDKRDRIERVSEIKSKVKRHAPPRREAFRSFFLSPRLSLRPPATPPGGRRQRLPPVPRDLAPAPGSAPRATAGNRARMLVMLVAACGTSSPVSFAASARF